MEYLSLLLLLVVNAVYAQDDDPRGQFCRRWYHEAGKVREQLFINDGLLNNVGKGGQNFTNSRLLYHDLSTVMLQGKNITMPPLMTNVSKTADVPSLLGGTLWADEANARLFQYGGQWPGDETPEDVFSLWSYDVYADKWGKKAAAADINRLSFGAGLSVESLGMGYYLGGYLNDRSVNGWSGPMVTTGNLLEYDMVLDEFRNTTTAEDGVGKAEGAMFYVPAGDQGMLVHFGGVRATDKDGVQPASLGTVDVYDMGNQKWHQQWATGDIPPSRRQFCGGITSAQDGSSHNIYIYGGRGFGVNQTGFDDVYILTIPSFVWIQVFPAKGVYRPAKDAYPHYGLTCSVINGAQMLIIGGQFPKDPTASECDAPDVAGVHNLVMSTRNKKYWGLFDPTETTYDVPVDIRNVIGGVPTGAAKVKVPVNGFAHPDLRVLFQTTITPTVRQPTRTNPANARKTSTPTSSPSKGPKKLLVILIPSIVGGLIVLGIGAFCFYRFRAKPKDSTMDDAPPPMYKSHESHVSPAVPYASTPLSPPSGSDGWGGISQLPDGTESPGGYHPVDQHQMGYDPYRSASLSSPPRVPTPPPVELPQVASPVPWRAWSPPARTPTSPTGTGPMTSEYRSASDQWRNRTSEGGGG